jgi:hypothetical protein
MTFMLTRARIVSGTAKGAAPGTGFEDERLVDRGTFAKELVSAFGFSPAAPRRAAHFSLPAGHPARESVEILESLGILDLYRSTRKFSPTAPVTRGEAAEMTMRAMTAGRP